MRGFWGIGVLGAILIGLLPALAGAGSAAEPPAAEPAAAEVQEKVRALARANAAVVGVHTVAVEDARSIDNLGRERRGTGVVIGEDGLVLTIGSLILEADRVELVLEPERIVPARVVAYDLADLLKAILPELRERGATRSSSRAWLGLNCVEVEGAVRVVRTAADGPAEAAGLLPGDRIDGVAVGDLAFFYQALWRGDRPEREVTLLVDRAGVEQTVTVQSQDRMKTLRRPKGI